MAKQKYGKRSRKKNTKEFQSIDERKKVPLCPQIMHKKVKVGGHGGILPWVLVFMILTGNLGILEIWKLE